MKVNAGKRFHLVNKNFKKEKLLGIKDNFKIHVKDSSKEASSKLHAVQLELLPIVVALKTHLKL